MQIDSTDGQFLELLREAASLALITNGAADADTVSAMMAFYHLFKSEKRKVVPVVPEAVPESCQGLPESSIIQNDLGPKNLIISLDTRGAPLEKISYSQEGSAFNLSIHPKERSFEVERIRYSYEGDRYDAFVVFGVQRLSDLGDIYSKNQKEFSQTPLVNLDYHSQNERFGSVNLIDTLSSSLCELLFKKLSVWQMVPGRETAKSLLNGLSHRSSADTENAGGTRQETSSYTAEGLLAKERDALIQ